MRPRILTGILALGALVGLAVAAAGVMWLLQPRQLISGQSISGTFSRIIDTGLAVGPLVVEFVPSVSLQESVKVEVAFPVSLMLRPVAVYPKSDAGRDKFYRYWDTEMLSRDLMQRLASRLGVTLYVGGAKVEPSAMQQMDYRSADNTLTAKWSVVLPKPGTHEGFVRTTLIDPKLNAGDGATDVEPQFRRDADIRIRVLDSKPPFSDLLAWIAVLIGIVLSLSNLIAFIWKWNERSKQLSLEREASRKIILP